MKTRIVILFMALAAIFAPKSNACTNVIVTKGASKDGSCMISYAADSHVLYGELYFHPAADWKPGTMLNVVEWDTYKPLGSIPQVAHTYQTVGNMNEHQLIIAETTWGGREEQMDVNGIMDYGSLIYITLQRARTAREAIETIVNLANTYGYHSEGETFSIADVNEAWIMDLVGKGSNGNKGIVWVARRIPDGYICAHANQCRITRFPLNDPENCLYAPDVISFAREQGWFDGKDEEFSFRDAYNPLDFGGARGCESRAWSAFNILGQGRFTYMENGNVRSLPADKWLPYAMGYELDGEMPLFIQPAIKVSAKMVADVMRDHFEGTPMDMTVDAGAGGNACPYRWRPMYWEADGHTYLNERAIATQQTGFWFVAQARGQYPDEIGALIWFGTDDAATSYLTPIYANLTQVPECLRVGNGDLLHYSASSQFWMCNRVTNSCYRMYNQMAPVVQAAANVFENYHMEVVVPEMDTKLMALYGNGSKSALKKVRKELTDFSLRTAQTQFDAWTNLEELLLVKFIDGNVKQQNSDGTFRHSEYYQGLPKGLMQPGYTERWKAATAKDNPEILKVK